jgi:RNA polymerase sigma-70 factor (ECF subfamily)
LNQLRSAKSRPVEVLDTETRDPISSPQLRAVLSAQRGELLDAALAKLSPDKREAIALRIVDELSYEEMADILGENVSTLRSRVHFGLKDLRAVIRRLE